MLPANVSAYLGRGTTPHPTDSPVLATVMRCQPNDVVVTAVPLFKKVVRHERSDVLYKTTGNVAVSVSGGPQIGINHQEVVIRKGEHFTIDLQYVVQKYQLSNLVLDVAAADIRPHTHGTHYFQEVSLGGYYRLSAQVTHDTTNLQLEVDVGRLDLSQVNVNQSVSAVVQQQLQITCIVEEATHQFIDQANWQQQVQNQPVPIHCKVSTLYPFAPTPQLIKDTKSFLSVHHTPAAFPVEFQRLVDAFYNRIKGGAHSWETKALLVFPAMLRSRLSDFNAASDFYLQLPNDNRQRIYQLLAQCCGYLLWYGSSMWRSTETEITCIRASLQETFAMSMLDEAEFIQAFTARFDEARNRVAHYIDHIKKVHRGPLNLLINYYDNNDIMAILHPPAPVPPAQAPAGPPGPVPAAPAPAAPAAPAPAAIQLAVVPAN